jgi:hypothetical protein
MRFPDCLFMHALMIAARPDLRKNNRLIKATVGMRQPARIIKPCLAQNGHELIARDCTITVCMKRLPSDRELTSAGRSKRLLHSQNGDKRVVVLSSRPVDFSGVRGGKVEHLSAEPT